MRRLLGSGSLALAGALVLGTAADVRADLKLDLRINKINSVPVLPSGAKTYGATQVGDVIELDFFGQVVDPGQPASSLAVLTVGGSFKSTGAGIKGSFAPNGVLGLVVGNPVPVTLVSRTPFNDNGSQPGAQKDLDGDGDLDLGGFNGDPAAEFAYMRIAPLSLSSFPGTPISDGAEWLIGSLKFTVTEASAQTALNFGLRRDGSANVLEQAAVWYQGSAIAPANPEGYTTATTGNVVIGSDVILMVPEPATACLLMIGGLGLLGRRRR